MSMNDRGYIMTIFSFSISIFDYTMWISFDASSFLFRRMKFGERKCEKGNQCSWDCLISINIDISSGWLFQSHSTHSNTHTELLCSIWTEQGEKKISYSPKYHKMCDMKMDLCQLFSIHTSVCVFVRINTSKQKPKNL